MWDTGSSIIKADAEEALIKLTYCGLFPNTTPAEVFVQAQQKLVSER